ncbi:DNA-binding NarL/FixJ family response regulator [Deinococcus metalli]|uniref:DNA-binding NarL/FixJ family response regulator n=1 Tax=Deinococcus metalli TaxID=1141878 RepID=A0A7W8KEW1_9DEIO|nr:hypothetical protein [Deinococcus metalli]MBB5375751.1 DNA-binding NarL/FixJ family response regulator [Deinococcus metalli]GHF37333.1 hypothetical protein GCM10017781_12510 [Deinococcus metalli]
MPAPRTDPSTTSVWVTDRLPLTHRVAGHYRDVWALHAAGLSDGEVADLLHRAPPEVRVAVRSVYRALALDPADGPLRREQAARLYRVMCAECSDRRDHVN